MQTPLICPLLLITLLGGAARLDAQPVAYRFEQIDSLQAVEARPVLVFLHTDWCRYCHRMEHTALRDTAVVRLLNTDFYFVSFDAETERDIRWRGHTFRFRPTGRKTGVHELAEALGTVDGRVAYPTVCILNPAFERIFQYNQALDAAGLLRVLRAVAGGG